MSDDIRWGVGTACAVGLLVSIVLILNLVTLPEMAGEIMERPSVLFTEGFIFLTGPLGYLLVGCTCVRHWKTVSQRELALMCVIAFGGTLLIFVAWPWVRRPEILVLCLGFWMLNGLGLTWLLRKRRRIMREANTEK